MIVTSNILVIIEKKIRIDKKKCLLALSTTSWMVTWAVSEVNFDGISVPIQNVSP